MNGELFRWLKLRWRGLFHRRAHETALNRELQYHVDMLITENVAAGMNVEEARFAALREFGVRCRCAKPAAIRGGPH